MRRILLNISLTTAILLMSYGAGIALEQPKLSNEQISELDQRDSELFGKIVGTWLFESMGENFVHVAQRTFYNEDGTFVSDYRISSAGQISFRRATGFWYPLMGWFCEEETKSTDGRLIPRLVRWVEDPISDELKTVSRTGMRAVLHRGAPVEKDFDLSLKGLSEKEFCAALESKNMLGFVSEKTGEKDSDGSPLYRWILKSKLTDTNEAQKPDSQQK